MGAPDFEPDVTREEVAAAAGGDISYFASGDHKEEAMQTMANGLTVRRLHDEEKLGGIIGMGGAGGTSIATTGMRVLPVDAPKVVVSTVAGGDVSTYAGARDIVFVPSSSTSAGSTPSVAPYSPTRRGNRRHDQAGPAAGRRGASPGYRVHVRQHDGGHRKGPAEWWKAAVTKCLCFTPPG